MTPPETSVTRRLDNVLAGPMIVLGLVVLGLFALILHLHDSAAGPEVLWICFAGLALLYPLVWLETLAHFLTGAPRWKRRLWCCLFPVLRMGCRDMETGTRIWFPLAGWREVNRELERKLARSFSIPMIVVALLVLPVIIMEFFWDEFVASHPGWNYSLRVAAAFIWAAFTLEYTLMMSVVRFKASWFWRHWIDLAIIILPMFTFIRAARLAQLVRVKQVARAARVYRLRGLGMRLWRALVTLQVVEKILSRNPEHRLEKLEMRLEEKEDEVRILKSDIERLKARIREKKASSEKAPNESVPRQSPRTSE